MPPAATAVERVRTRYALLTARHRQVADYMLAHPFEAATLSIDAMARRCGVATATMNRFAASLEYDGYSSLRAHWQQVLQRQTTPGPLDKLQAQRSAPTPSQQRLHTALQTGATQLQTAAELLEPGALQAIVELLTGARRIAVLGSDVTAYLAGYFVSYAGLFHPAVEAINGLGGVTEAQRRIMTLTDQDLLLALSLPRYSSLTVELCAQASEAGVPVLALTDSPQAPMLAHARHALIAPAQHPMLPASGVGLLGLLECLCMLLATHSTRSRDELARIAQAGARFHQDARVHPARSRHTGATE